MKNGYKAKKIIKQNMSEKVYEKQIMGKGLMKDRIWEKR